MVVEAAAAVTPDAANAKNAVNGADRAADARTDRTADYATHGPRRGRLRRTFLRSANDALGLSRMGDRQPSQRDRRGRELQFCGPTSRPRYRPDLIFISIPCA